MTDKTRYEVTLISTASGHTIEVYDTVGQIWLAETKLGRIKKNSAIVKLQKLEQQLNS